MHEKLAACFGCVLTLWQLPAIAQEVEAEEGMPALSQQRKEPRLHSPDAALTASVGGQAGLRYHDNLYRSPHNEEDDFIAVMNPGFALRGDLNPYTLRVDGEIERGQFASEQDNNYTDGDLRALLHYTPNTVDTLSLDGRFRYDHVETGAFADDPGQQSDEPTPYRYGEAGARWKRETPQWVGWLDGRLSYYNYDNTDRLNGTPYISDDRDFSQNLWTLRGGYKFWPETVLYLQSGLNQRGYGKRIDTSLNEPRDSFGYELLAGLAWGHKESSWQGDIATGYLRQNYDFAPLTDVGVPALRASLQWQPDTAWRWRGDASRDIREATLAATSSYIQSRLRLRAEYLALPQWTLGSSLRYTENDFQVNPFSAQPKRTDDIWDGGFYADYSLTEDYSLGGEYLHIDRDSDDPAAIYDSNILFLRLGVNY